MIKNPKLNAKIKSLPLSPGIYIYKNKKGEIIYVGKSVRLRDRVKSYFVNEERLLPKTKRLVSEIDDIDYIETESEIEALLLEASLIKKHQPFYNIQGKDDKRAKYIKVVNAKARKNLGIKKTIERELWPWITTTRQIDDKDSLFFGPFPAGNTVNKVLKVLRHTFPWCAYKSKTQARRAKKPCFYSHINLCPGICDNKITLREYWEIFDNLVLFLQGKKKTLQRELSKRMNLAAKREDFEKAAFYRDTLSGIDYITQRFRDSAEYLKNPNLLDDLRAQEINDLISILEKLGVTLSANEIHDFYIEGYDISNSGSDFAVGSRVAFIGGEPDKRLYRKYKIKKAKTPDDYAAMKEVLRRRLKGDGKLPNLILVDGGIGQVNAALMAMEETGKFVPVVGLEKKFETLIVPHYGVSSVIASPPRRAKRSNNSGDYHVAKLRFPPRNDGNNTSVIALLHAGEISFKLPKHSPARRLVQRIRDEAHRFANSYRKKLRKIT